MSASKQTMNQAPAVGPATPISAKAGKVGAWTENEKMALLVEVIRHAGAKPAWKDIRFPAGRTVGGTQKIWEAINKQFPFDVEFVGGSDIAPTKAKGTGKAGGAKGGKGKKGGAQKGKTGGGDLNFVAGGDEGDDEEETGGKASVKKGRAKSGGGKGGKKGAGKGKGKRTADEAFDSDGDEGNKKTKVEQQDKDMDDDKKEFDLGDVPAHESDDEEDAV